ncbi:MAG: oxidoreductase [Rhodospirillaceae bacterium]|nr:oxidoreductase [Rhodospirillaceae bacterium]|tara:strand:- start:197 stop:919 length:723 start_codon:yes stop_codon:yes gene_type:complete
MKKTSQRLLGRVALITGASRGIGAAIAKRYAKEGAQVILIARTTAGLEDVDDFIREKSNGKSQATLLPMDLKNFEEIEKIGPAINERFGKLDIFVANASQLGNLTPIREIDTRSWQNLIDINLTANLHLIKTLSPLLLRSNAGRALFLTSGVSGGRAYWGGYAVTKTALEAMVRTWSEEMTKTKLKINLINPGGVRTEMRASAYPGEDPQNLPPPEDITEVFVKLAETECEIHGKTVNAQ